MAVGLETIMNTSIPGPTDIADELQGWIGKTLVIDDEITLPAVRRIAAMDDLDPSGFRRGDAILPHWYSMFFTLNARQSQLGHDGHPRKGEFLPPIPLPRRMFAGRKAEFRQPLRIGDMAVKRSEIMSIKQKTGRSGPLVFLTVRHTIEVEGKPALIEYQEVVYRGELPANVVAPTSTVQSAPLDAQWTESLFMDPVLVFRYSAATWNSHRIHYDAEYSRTQEKYPGCVMNGALTIHRIIDAALRNAPGKRLTGLEARLFKPLFVGETVVLAGKHGDDGRVEAWAADKEGALAGTVSLQFDQ